MRTRGSYYSEHTLKISSCDIIDEKLELNYLFNAVRLARQNDHHNIRDLAVVLQALDRLFI
jgi:hypothetical protein